MDPRRRCQRCKGPLEAVPLVFTLTRWCDRCQHLFVRPQDDQAVHEEAAALGGLGVLRPGVVSRPRLKRAA